MRRRIKRASLVFNCIHWRAKYFLYKTELVLLLLKSKKLDRWKHKLCYRYYVLVQHIYICCIDLSIYTIQMHIFRIHMLYSICAIQMHCNAILIYYHLICLKYERADVEDICILLSNEMSTISELHIFLLRLSRIPVLHMFLVNMS